MVILYVSDQFPFKIKLGYPGTGRLKFKAPKQPLSRLFCWKAGREEDAQEREAEGS